ncbi:MAG: hypothetical protein JST12_14740 [Armatimonadetes bacterium]|nr:hypothetical protein [Armatimonadota bacterium]
MRPSKWIPIPLIATWALAGVLGGCSTGAKNSQDGPGASSNPVEPTKPHVSAIVCSPEQLVKEFSESTNPVASEDAAKGKVYEVTAPISSIGTASMGGTDLYIVFEAHTDKIPSPSVQFRYPASFRSQVATLKVGDTVKCVGSFDKVEFGGDVAFNATELSKP